MPRRYSTSPGVTGQKPIDESEEIRIPHVRLVPDRDTVCVEYPLQTIHERLLPTQGDQPIDIVRQEERVVPCGAIYVAGPSKSNREQALDRVRILFGRERSRLAIDHGRIEHVEYR